MSLLGQLITGRIITFSFSPDIVINNTLKCITTIIVLLYNRIQVEPLLYYFTKVFIRCYKTMYEDHIQHTHNYTSRFKLSKILSKTVSVFLTVKHTTNRV